MLDGEEEILGEDNATILGGDDEGSDDNSSDTGDDKGESSDDTGDNSGDNENDGDNADDKADDKDTDGEADTSNDGAPENYDDFKMPEGMDVDKEALEAALPIFKDLNLTQEQAQTLVDVQAKQVEGIVKAQAEEFAKKQSDWNKAAMNDEEYGKGKFEASAATARSAVLAIGGTDLKDALNETGAGNHPELIRAFVRIGNAIGEDTVDFGSSETGQQKSLAQRIYGKD